MQIRFVLIGQSEKSGIDIESEYQLTGHPVIRAMDLPIEFSSYVPVHLLLLLPVENDASSDPNEAFISTKNDNGANRLALNLLPPLFPNHRTVDSIDF